jgi:hypothetical protein
VQIRQIEARRRLGFALRAKDSALLSIRAHHKFMEGQSIDVGVNTILKVNLRRSFMIGSYIVLLRD